MPQRALSLPGAAVANIRPTPTGRYQLTITNKLLPKGRKWFTFDSQAEAEVYATQVEKWLAAGLVPPELAADSRSMARPDLLGPLIRAWANSGHPSAADQETLGRLYIEVGAEQVAALSYSWAERWVLNLKLQRNLAPGSIRKRVQALSRALDWHLRKTPDLMVGNPLKLLPKGYSAYTTVDAEHAQALGKRAKRDTTRVRRLQPGDEQAIRRALAGEKRADRERGLLVDTQFMLLFDLILHTGLRLREAYRLRVDQVDLVGRVMRPQVSKKWHGEVAHRLVPLKPALHRLLADHLAGPAGQLELVFGGLWSGDTSAQELKRATGRLSARFAALFAYAGIDGITEHDLRHEATCRWFEMRPLGGAAGSWLYRREEINAIMGWAPGSVMADRYASFRAEDLASRMWPADVGAKVA